MENFHAKLTEDAVRSRAVDPTVAPIQKKAITLLAAAQKLPNVSPAEQAILAAAQQAIRLARFSNLPAKLSAFQKAVAKERVSTAAYLDKLLEILRTYPLQVEDDAPTRHAPVAPAPGGTFLPEIILSESFTAPGKT